MRTCIVFILVSVVLFGQTTVLPPNAPRVTAAPHATPQTHWVDLAWDPSDTPGVTYNVFRTGACVGCSCLQNPYSLAANIAGTVWSDQNVKHGKNYCYKVTAVLGTSQSTPTPPVIAMVP